MTSFFVEGDGEIGLVLDGENGTEVDGEVGLVRKKKI